LCLTLRLVVVGLGASKWKWAISIDSWTLICVFADRLSNGTTKYM
jgi:hypothetical protein